MEEAMSISTGLRSDHQDAFLDSRGHAVQHRQHMSVVETKRGATTSRRIAVETMR